MWSVSITSGTDKPKEKEVPIDTPPTKEGPDLIEKPAVKEESTETKTVDVVLLTMPSLLALLYSVHSLCLNL